MRNFTKAELLAYVQLEMSYKTIDKISIKSLAVIADILCIDLSDTTFKENNEKTN